MTFYIKINNGYIFDVVDYDPGIQGYDPINTDHLPEDILNGCYQLKNDEFILDEEKHKLFLEEIDKYAPKGETDV